MTVIYLSHLKEDGILAFHITNRFLDLIPVVWTDDFSSLLSVLKSD